MVWNDKRMKIAVILLLSVGILLRFYFYFGHVYSDDAYYNYLAYSLFNGNYGADYIGYPILRRIGQSAITAFSFKLFGTNETATTVFPFLFSIVNMLLCYKITKVITKSEISAVIVLLFTAFYPTEILFASVAFTDLFSTVFINSGILLLFLADRDKKLWYSIFAGVLFMISVLFKINVFYTSLLLTGLFIYQLFARNTFNRYIFISLAVLGLGIFTEGIIYYFINGDLFYRIAATGTASNFSHNDFFGEGSQVGYAKGQYLSALARLIFIENPKALFLRRSMVFIPFIAMLELVVHRKKRHNRLVVYWFLGLAFLYLFFTMSLTAYKPNVLRFTWYLFPLFLPSMILASRFFIEMKKGWMFLLLALYIFYSLLMTQHFRDYFEMSHIDRFNKFLKNNSERVIYTDHFTKYSIDLIDGLKDQRRTKRLYHSKQNFIPSGSLIVYHTGHINELSAQGFSYPAESFYRSSDFVELKRFGPFIIFEKL